MRATQSAPSHIFRMLRQRNALRVDRPGGKLWFLSLVFLVMGTAAFTRLHSSVTLLGQDQAPGPNGSMPLGTPRTSDCDAPSNPIVRENCLPGSDGWQVAEPSYTIAGFPLPTSVPAGGVVNFYASTDAPQFDILIYRSGYYGGRGARLITRVNGLHGKVQAPCLDDPSTGLRSCTNWTMSYSLDIPVDWVSGIYLAVLTRGDDGRQSTLTFIVRDDLRQPDILYQYSLSTYQAYNNYGGKSLYSFNSGLCDTVAGAPRAVKVSLARPHIVPPMDPTSYFRVDYPMVYWLEEQGYDVSYSTSFDTHRSGSPGQHNALLDHRIFLAVGHDEYWSGEMRAAMTEARDAGVHLAYLTGNTGYWKIRLEPDPWTGQPDLTMVTYKTAEGGPADPTGEPTSLWRDPAGPNQPENELVGIQFVGDNDNRYFPLRIPSGLAKDQVFRNTGLQQLPPGTHVDIGEELVGWEWDGLTPNGLTPPGLTLLSASPAYGDIATGGIESYRVGTAVSNASRYTTADGAMVFAAGTIQWSWGLAIVEPDRRIQQITYNLFSDMGIQPATPSSTLLLDGAVPPAEGHVSPAVGKTDATIEIGVQEVKSSVDGSSAVIQWRTDQPARGEAWLVTDKGATLTRIQGGGPTVAEDSADGLSHRAVFTSLASGAAYHYVVVAAGQGDQFGISDIQEFQVPPAMLLDRVRQAGQIAVQETVCAVKPVVRPTYYWIKAHWLASGLALAVFLAGGTWVVLRLRNRRLYRPEA